MKTREEIVDRLIGHAKNIYVWARDDCASTDTLFDSVNDPVGTLMALELQIDNVVEDGRLLSEMDGDDD